MVDPTIPSLVNRSVLVYATNPLVIDISSPGFVQTPACGYGLINTFTWTIPTGAPITQDTSTPKNWYKLTTTTTDPKKDATYTVSLNVSAYYGGLDQTFTKTVTFTIVVTDPCLTTVLTPLTGFTDMTIQCGATANQLFLHPTDSAAISQGTATICGARSYTVFKIISGVDTAQTWFTVTATGVTN
jgi:hypothetical protein